jgi:IS30 family transposase
MAAALFFERIEAMRHFYHLTHDDRIKIEALLKEKHTPKEIANNIGCHISTIYRELKRGRYEHRCERGSNENQNRMIRRHVPKGTDFDTVSGDTVKQIEIWINNYPRRLFNYGTAEERFNEEMAKLEGC